MSGVRLSFVTLCTSLALSLPAVASPPAPDEGASESARQAFAALPFTFEENRGQVAPEVGFLARRGQSTIYLTTWEAVLVLPGGHALRLQLPGAATPPELVAERPAESRVNYLIGADPTRWTTDVPTWDRVRYAEVQPGIDVVFYGDPTRLEYDVVVAPGADPAAFELTLVGVDRMRVDAVGDLRLEVGGVELAHRAPRIFQTAPDGTRHGVTGRYELRGDGRVGFDVDAYDVTRELVIDPVLDYGTYVGGAGDDNTIGIAIDRHGSAHLVGYAGVGFPTFGRDPLMPERPEVDEVFYALKLSPDGRRILWSTFIAGVTATEGVPPLNLVGHPTLDREGRLYIPGLTNTVDFPVTANAFDPSYNGGCDIPIEWACGDGVLVVLDPDGSRLRYGTYLGGSGQDWLFATSLKERGAEKLLLVSGGTSSPDFPTSANAVARSPTGHVDAMVAVLDVSRVMRGGRHRPGDLVYGSYLGGNDFDFAHDVEWAGDKIVATGEYFAFTQHGHIWRALPDTTLVCASDAHCSEGGTCVGAWAHEPAIPCAIDGECPWPDGVCFEGRCHAPGSCEGGSGVMWCGIAADDPRAAGWATPPGYGNDWDQRIEKAFDLPAGPASIRYVASFDLEPGYDYLRVEVSYDDGASFELLEARDGTSAGFEAFDVALPASYEGARVIVRFRVTSDGAWSDEDGWYPSHGAAAIDRVEVTGHPVDDFEGVDDGWVASERFDSWVAMPATHHYGVGGGVADGFVAQLDPFAAAGASLDWSAIIGGRAWEFAFDLAVDARGNVYVTGDTSSPDLPTTPGVIGPAINGWNDAYVVSLDPRGELRYLTYFGGSAEEGALAISADARGNAYVTGNTDSDDFPVSPDALQPVRLGDRDYYVMHLAPDGRSSSFATYLGGVGYDAWGISELGPDGALYVVVASTESDDLPATEGAALETYQGGGDAFLGRITLGGIHKPRR